MNIWHDCPKDRINKDEFCAVIEIEEGSKVKYELDKETGMLIVDRILSTSMLYPANYGFIPKTLSEDNDPLDVLVLCREKILPLSLVECIPIAVLKMIDDGQNDEKIIAVAKGDKALNKIRCMKEIQEHIFKEMVHFFSYYKTLENKKTEVLGVEDENSAKQIIEEAIKRYEDKYGK